VLSFESVAPELVIPHEETDALAKLEGQPWKTLSPEQYDRLRQATEGWLNTDPPQEYAHKLGTHDRRSLQAALCRDGQALAVIGLSDFRG
jgi:hypothetical protein